MILTSDAAARDIVTVNVAFAADSSDVVTSFIEIVGAVSSSVIVMVVDWAPFSVAEPPDTLSIAMIAVSLPSYVLSSVGVKVVVPVRLPAEIEMLESDE